MMRTSLDVLVPRWRWGTIRNVDPPVLAGSLDDARQFLGIILQVPQPHTLGTAGNFLAQQIATGDHGERLAEGNGGMTLKTRLARLEGANGSVQRFIVAVVSACTDVTQALADVGVTAGAADMVVVVRKPGDGVPRVTVDGAER
jgi:hypothetical protein